MGRSLNSREFPRHPRQNVSVPRNGTSRPPLLFACTRNILVPLKTRSVDSMTSLWLMQSWASSASMVPTCRPWRRHSLRSRAAEM